MRLRHLLFALPLCVMTALVFGVKHRMDNPPLTPGDYMLREWAAQSDRIVLYSKQGVLTYVAPPGQNLLNGDSPIIRDLHLAAVPADGLPFTLLHWEIQADALEFRQGSAVRGQARWQDFGNSGAIIGRGIYWSVKPPFWKRFRDRLRHEASVAPLAQGEQAASGSLRPEK